MAGKSICVPVSTTVREALVVLAWREEREPRRQAARLIREGLIRAGVLVETADPVRAVEVGELEPAR